MHLFKTRLLSLFRDKTVIFWALIFPIILSTFFSLAFKNIATGDIIQTIDIAVVEDENIDLNLLNLLNEVEINENEKMFAVVRVSEEEAQKLLADKEVEAIIKTINNKINLIVNSSGLNETIVKAMLDEYLQTTTAVMDIMVLSASNPEEIIRDLSNSKTYIDEVGKDKDVANAVLIMYFSVIGMALIYGGFWGTDNIRYLQANLSTKGIRVAVSPVNRFKMILIYTLATFVVHILIILIFLLYLILALGINFGDKLPFVSLICVLGSLVGITFGSFIAISLKKANAGIKVMITTLVGIIGGFFSGMMMLDMKYIIQVKAPFLNYINPVGVITDALHTLNYFGVTPRFYLNIGILAIMVIAFTIGTFLFYRSDSYESV